MTAIESTVVEILGSLLANTIEVIGFVAGLVRQGNKGSKFILMLWFGVLDAYR